MRHASLKFAAFFALLLTLAASVFAADAGVLERVSGSVVVTGVDNKIRPAVAKEKLQPGEVVATEAKSEAMIKLADDSTVLIRPNTKFRIDEFSFEKSPSDSSMVSVLTGTMRMITGLIGKAAPAKVKVSANTSTIGIRGTDFEVAVLPEDMADARAGVYDYVHAGETQISIPSGQSLNVKRSQTAFAPEKLRPGEEPLQLLAQPPLFLQQGGGFDALVQSLTTAPMNVIQHMPLPFR